MYIYASLGGTIYRFRTMSWVQWLNRMKEETANNSEIGRFATPIGVNEGDMIDWDENDVEYALNKIARRKRR